MDAVCLHERFERQVGLSPGAPAITFEGETLTYGDLNSRANQLANYLQECGVGVETHVGLCLDRGFDTVVAILAVLKAGGAYVPMDPVYPAERVRLIVEDAECPVILVHENYAERFHGATGTHVIELDSGERPWEALPESNLSRIAEPSNLAYVIYTSGSTGTPKGVLITHHNVARLFTSTDHWFGFVADDVWTLFHSYAFDFSVWEMWGALLYGGRLVIVPYSVSRSPVEYYQLLLAEGVTILNQTPSAFWQLDLYDETVATEHSGTLVLRYIFLGGETLVFRSLKRWFDRHGDNGPAVVNLYGITETSVIVTFRPVSLQDTDPSTPNCIGIPTPDTPIYVLDSDRRPVLPGDIGELYVGGPGVGRGYLNRPELTAERFIIDPIADLGRFYKTGDLVRVLDSDLEFLGRNDTQVQIRGFRVELGETESVICSYPGVRGAVVRVLESTPGDQRLVAYYLAQQTLAVAELREYLEKTIPAYMVPSAFIHMDAFPLNNNGKTDYHALPEPVFEHTGGDYVAPRNDLEASLVAIWQELLRIPKIGVNDNFFALGGHSLLATRLIVRIKNQFSVHLPLRAIVDGPTISGCALAIGAAMETSEVLQRSTLAPREHHAECAPLSFSQERLWIIEQIQPDITAYQIPVFFEIVGALDPDRFQRAFQQVVQRHDVLRTVIVLEDGRPIQRVLEDVNVPFDVLALDDSLEDLEAGAAARQALSVATHTPMDLASGPLLKLKLYCAGAKRWYAGLIVHHVIFDGWSVSVMLDELAANYSALAEGQDAELPRLPLQYADFAAWQREQTTSPNFLEQLAFWRRTLEGPLPVLDLPADFPRPPIQIYSGNVAQAYVSAVQTQTLEQLALHRGKTLFVLLLAGWELLLHCYSGQDDIVIGSALAGRNHEKLEPLIGFFVNTVVLRTRLEREMQFTAFLDRIEDVVLAAQENQDVPFERVVAEVQHARDASRSPIFQVLFVLHNTPRYGACFSGLRITGEEISNGCAKFDLTLAVQPKEGGLLLNLEYNTAIFESATAERILCNFQILLDSIVAAPEAPLDHFQMLTPGEQQKILVEWNNTQTEYPSNACVHRIFEEQAEMRPSATALTFQGNNVSYQELNGRANQLAHFLQAKGVGPEYLVATYLERSVTQIVVLLAILKAGGAYVPLDLAAPKKRLKQMLRDTGAQLLVTTSTLENKLPGDYAAILRVDKIAPEVDAFATCNLASVEVHARNMAYVMYTSGSSGVPKGACIEHRSIVRLVRDTNYADFSQDHVFLQFAPVSFDASTFEIWGPLLNGARLVIYPPDFTSFREFGDFLLREQVTTLWLTAGLFHKMVDAHLDALSGLRQLLAGGDILSPSRVRRFLESLPHCALINGYGPTEATTFSCCHTLGSDEDAESVSIGSPISNTRVYVLDPWARPVPVGIAGELYIGGDGVARGYLNRPDDTRERFIPDPFCSPGVGTMYRTGDLVQWLSNGTLKFLGRMDNQIKLRGFRVELNEIELALEELPRIGKAAVLLNSDSPRGNRLVAYVVPTAGVEINLDETRRCLSESLPDYMLPSALVTIKDMPLNSNGKIDRVALSSFNIGETANSEAESVVDPKYLPLIALWKQLLNLERIGPDDNFFDLGGNSLLALEMVDAVWDEFSVRISLRSFLEHPTVRQLAAVLDNESMDEDLTTSQDSVEDVQKNLRPTAVPLRSTGSRLPFFFICGAADVAKAYGCLASHMSPDQPFYGIQESLESLETGTVYSVNELADQFIECMREIQPHGPYCLGGWSFGGVVAFQMAQRLHEFGERVLCLVLVDCEARPLQVRWYRRSTRDKFDGLLRSTHRLLRSIRQRIRTLWYALPLFPDYAKEILQIAYTAIAPITGTGRQDLQVREYLQWVREDMQENYEFRMALKMGSTTHRSRLTYTQDPYIRTLHRIMRHRRIVMESYITKEYPGHIVLIRASKVPREWYFSDRSLGWEGVAKEGVDLNVIPGDHMSIIREPDVREFARVLQRRLDDASTL